MNIFQEFEWRGMIHSASEGLETVLANTKVTAYIGFDPSANSLHVGSLLPVMGLVHLQRYGHTPIAIVGGGTGMIGDPSGKTQERTLLTLDQIEANLEGLRQQLNRFLDFNTKTNPAIVVNNADWLLPLSTMDFLREIGKYFTINYMLAKESVKRRLEQEDGLSFTEFSYMLLQAYDYLTLYDRYGCLLQMGGSDQWGNIVAGTELIRRLRGGEAYALVFPLVTTSSGVKFGKTEAGTVWLDPNRTSPFRFYQFWLNTEDNDVITYLSFFTLLDKQTIDDLQASLASAPEERKPHRRLAQEVTCMVHGETALKKAEQATQILFGDEIDNIAAADLEEIFADVPSIVIKQQDLDDRGIPLPELLKLCKFSDSKAQSRRLVEGGGIYVNNRRITDTETSIDLSLSIEGKLLVLRKGKKNYCLVRIQR